jgi:high-affinity iron transporter
VLAALLIVFREVIEAGLIVGIVLAATRGVAGRSRMVVGGVLGGVFGACVLAAFAGRLADLFAGSGQELFNAGVLLAAVAMLTWHNVWMAAHGRQMAQELRAVGARVASGERPPAALAAVVGIAVLREGAEVVLFLAGVLSGSGVSVPGVAFGGVLGIAGGALVAVLMYRGLLAIPAARLFQTTSWLITLLAAGMAAQAMGFLQQGGFTNLMQTPLWDTSAVLSQDSIPGRLAHTLIGYTDQPNGLQVLAWVATVGIIWGLGRLVTGGTARPGGGPMRRQPTGATAAPGARQRAGGSGVAA